LSEDSERIPRVLAEREIIIRLDPVSTSKFFEHLAQEIAPEVEEDVRAPSIVKAALLIANEVTKESLSTFLGQVMDPRWNIPQFKDRACQVIEALLDYYRKGMHRLLESARVKAIRGEEIERELEKLDRLLFAINLAAREVINRLFILLTINAPADARPALANVRLGYERVRVRAR